MLTKPLPRWVPAPSTAARALTVALLGLASVGCNSMQFEKIPDAQVDATRKATAETFATTTLQAWSRDEYPALGDEASEEMKKGNTPEAQKAADKAMEKDLGNFKSLVFAEAFATKPARFEVHRFKGTFDKLAEQCEIRVVFDTDGKVSGFWVKPWREGIQ